MEEKVKYAVFLVVVVLVSVCSSYITTLVLKPNSPGTNVADNQPQRVNTNSTTSIVHASSYQTKFSITYNSLVASYNYVIVYSDVAIKNLTITYQYTALNGTALETKVSYGDFYPVWGTGTMVQAGAIPSTNYVIPDYIMNACSSIKDDAQGYPAWDVYPQLNVTDISGYS